MKKAQIELSFNWIFVMIAGFAILMFFYMIINTQTASSQEQLSRSITQRMSSIFDSIQASPNTAEVHPRVSFELEFTCFNGIHEFRRGGGSSSAYLENSIIFTPKRIGGTSLLTLNKRLSMPFLITPILYLSDQRTHYHFDNSLLTVYNSLDDVFSKSNGSIEELEDLSATYRRIIYVTTTTPTVSLPSNVDVVKVNQSENSIKFGESEEKLFYFSNDMLLGAIISGDYEISKCNFDKINQSFERVKTILNTRKSNLTNIITNTDCKQLYEDMNLENLNFNTPPAIFYANSSLIESRNRELERFSCPTIY